MCGAPPAYHDEAGVFGPEPVYGVLAERAHVLLILRGPREAYPRGLAEGADIGHVLRAGAPAVLLRAADYERAQPHAGADVQRAYALGRVYLVPGDAYQIRAEGFGGKGYLQKALHRVSVDEGLRIRGLDNFGHGLYVRHCAGLVVHQHERAEYRVRPHGPGHLLGRHRAGAARP